MDSKSAEAVVEEQAVKFEEQKDYLVDLWTNGARASRG